MGSADPALVPAPRFAGLFATLAGEAEEAPIPPKEVALAEAPAVPLPLALAEFATVATALAVGPVLVEPAEPELLAPPLLLEP